MLGAGERFLERQLQKAGLVHVDGRVELAGAAPGPAAGAGNGPVHVAEK